MRDPARPESASFSQAAHRIADDLARKKKRVRGGGVTWLRPDRKRIPDQPARMVATGADLYDGIPGIAVFLAAMARTEGREDCRELALEALAGWRSLLLGIAEQPNRAGRIAFGIGGYTGLGSFVYALATLSDLLEEPILLEEAWTVFSLLRPEQIEQDQINDLIAGSAGTLLALLAFAGVLPSSRAARVLDCAELCAARLAAAATPLTGGAAGWKNHPLYPEQTGFAHGAAGIACALLSLHRRRPSPAWRELAARAWRYERSTFSSELGNWRDLTGLSPGGYMDQWCYGAPGIALGRLLTLDLADDPAVRGEIEAGLANTDAPELAASDHWCCGELGRVEVLMEAADRLGSPSLRRAAEARTERLLDRRQQRGRYFGMVDSPEPDPTLLSGEAGIGYTLLRLAHPGRLPCILALRGGRRDEL